MPIKGSSEKGDMIVRVGVWIPAYNGDSLEKLRDVFERIG